VLVSPAVVSLIAFACVFGGALLGMLLRSALPETHLGTDSKDVVKLGMGLVASMAALVLSLLIASAKGSFDTQRDELMQSSAKVVLLDRVLAHYGADAKESRELLRGGVAGMIERTWPSDSSRSGQLEPTGGGEPLYDKVLTLTPQTDAQRSLQAEALSLIIDLGQTRWLLFEQGGSSISTPFLVVMVFWLTILFTSFGLFAPRNGTVIATMLVCALSVAGAVFLLLELDQPFGGFIRISSAPLRDALAHLGR
jgi:hypothetical protein